MNRYICRILAIAGLALTVLACSTGYEADRDAVSKRVEAYLAANPGTDPETAEEMRAFRLRNGMTEAEVRATWGEPDEVLKHTDEIAEWRFSCDFPHLCQSRPGRPGPAIRPNAFIIDGKLDRWNP